MELAQLPLSIGLRDDATFANFYSDNNAQAVNAVLALAKGSGKDDFIYLYANAAGAGKTHLLQAACHVAYEYKKTAVFIPLSECTRLTVNILTDLANMDLVCVDDIDGIAGSPNWEEALFHLYNYVKASSARLLISANCAPPQLRIALPDLKSRLACGVSYQLQPLSDEQKLLVIKARAHSRGIKLDDTVSKFLLSRCPRDMTQLFAALAQLDRASLVEKRRVTIPFVKEVLGI